MSNELAELKFEASFKPNEITIVNEEKLANLVEQVAAKYENMVFSDKTIKEAKEARADLNKSADQIEKARKNVKTDFEKPLQVFEAKMKKYSERIKKVSETIDKQVKSYEEKQKENRLAVIRKLIQEEADKARIDVSAIQLDKTWLNAGSFTPKGNPVKKVIEDIQGIARGIVDEINRIENEKLTVKNFAELADVDVIPYIAMVDRGISSEDIIETIKQAIEQKKKREEQEAEQKRQTAIQQAEEAKIAEQRQKEQQELVEKVNHEFQKQINSGQSVKTVVSQVATEEKLETIEEIMEFTLHIKGKKSALYALNQYMKANDIEFKKVVDK